MIRGALTASLRIQTAPFGNIDLNVLGIRDSFHFISTLHGDSSLLGAIQQCVDFFPS